MDKEYIAERIQKWDERFDEIHDFSMEYETAVTPFFLDDYLTEFYDFYEVRDRSARLVPAEEDLLATLREVSGVPYGDLIGNKALSLFGTPHRITVFDNDRPLCEETSGPTGYAPFFFVFGYLFAEYEGFTLCFISGTNN